MFGLPVVVSDRVGCRHLLDTGGGFVFAAGDERALADALRKLSASVELRETAGLAARHAIAPHTIETWADAVFSALRIETT